LALSPENLRSSFRRAGIYPYNPEAVPSYLLKPSEVYRNAQDQNPKEQEIQECGGYGRYVAVTGIILCFFP
jgi:hypothetical protein